MNDLRPGYTIARCCRNCLYYKTSQKTSGGERLDGSCTIHNITDESIEPVSTHGTCVCDAHSWKPLGRNIHRIAMKYNAKVPDDTI